MSNNFFCLFVIYFEYLFLPPKLSIKMQMTLCHHIHHSMAELNWKAAASAAPPTASQKITWSISHQFVHPSISLSFSHYTIALTQNFPMQKFWNQTIKQKKKQIKFKFLLHYTNRMEKFTFFGYSFFSCFEFDSGNSLQYEWILYHDVSRFWSAEVTFLLLSLESFLHLPHVFELSFKIA